MKERQYEIIWPNTIFLTLVHIGSLYGFYLVFTKMRLITLFIQYVIVAMGATGLTAGAHRLWSHRSYKANFRLRLILAYLCTSTYQRDIYYWARDHSYVSGFTISSMIQMLILIIRSADFSFPILAATVDLSDLERDSIVVFQRKYYKWIAPICSFVIPALIPYYLFNEPLDVVFYACTLSRYVFMLHCTFTINSVTHMWGARPFDKNLSATNGVFCSIISCGEGWHNYHHAFPYDYRPAELGGYHFNLTKAFIDFFAKIGWAYDLKTVAPDIIESRIKRTGDGTHPISIKELESDEAIWGWNDKDMTQELRDKFTIMHTVDREL